MGGGEGLMRGDSCQICASLSCGKQGGAAHQLVGIAIPPARRSQWVGGGCTEVQRGRRQPRSRQFHTTPHRLTGPALARWPAKPPPRRLPYRPHDRRPGRCGCRACNEPHGSGRVSHTGRWSISSSRERAGTTSTACGPLVPPSCRTLYATTRRPLPRYPSPIARRRHAVPHAPV